MNKTELEDFYEMLEATDATLKNIEKKKINQENFVKNIYYYYIKGGFYVIITSKILNILSLLFGSFFTLFTFNLIDWNKIITCDKIHEKDILDCGDISMYITLNGILNPNFFQILMLIFNTGGILLALYNLLTFFYEYYELLNTKEYYNKTLKISDSKLCSKTWTDIIFLISEKNNRIPIDKITNIILKKENYFIGLINSNIFNVPNVLFTKQLEFNLFHFLSPIEFWKKDSNEIKKRLVFLGIINFLLIPFMLIYIICSFLFRNIDEIYLHKKVLGPRRYTLLSKWKFREYNELQHYFDERINISVKYAYEYTKQFPSLFIEKIANFISLLSGAFIGLFLLFSILDENILLYVTFLNRSLIFYTGIFASVSAISRSFIREPEDSVYNPNIVMEKVAKYTHYMPNTWKGKCNTNDVHNEFLSMFSYIIILFFYEIISVFTTPYLLLFVIYKDVKKFEDFIKKNTVYVKNVGSVCSLSNFQNDDINTKLESSILSFSENHPTWKSTENIKLNTTK